MDPGTLYGFAHQFYWDFRRLSEGGRRWRFNPKKHKQVTEDLDNSQLIDDDDRARHQRMVDDEIQGGAWTRPEEMRGFGISKRPNCRPGVNSMPNRRTWKLARKSRFRESAR